ncbi:MAG: hypothetical protein OXU96_09225 [Gammaproteobacteria bacterium]|nr:hypothetical protein [Gammaproteobacteria bacterium]
MISTILIVVIAARLFVEHRCNKQRQDAFGKAGGLLLRLSAQCNARPKA